MSLLATATAWLVEPADDPPALTAAPPPSTGEAPLSRVAVLGPPAAVPPLAAAIGLTCRARARVPAALVALWPSAGADDSGALPHTAGPALPGAAALAARLSRRGLPVSARGRLAWLALPAGAEEAVPMLRNAEAACGDVPVVLAIARPRDAAVDAVLAERDLLVVAASPESPLAGAAGADVSALGVPARACAPLPPGAPRLAALAGLRGPRLDLWTEMAMVFELPGRAPAPALRPATDATPHRPPGPQPSEEAW
jgi:hypothetical protein